jgi:catechol 2,3-dioxygenase-like lactoylglutathione lyase family enzyme
VTPAARFQGFHHVQLAMPAGQEDAAERFYSGVLAMERIPKPAHLAGRGGCWFRSGHLELHLGVEEDFRPARKAHPALVVDGLADLRQRLERVGVEVVEDTQLEGHERFYAPDPFGNRLEFIEAH